MQELVEIPNENAMTIFTAEKGLDPFLAKIKQEIDNFKPDTTTAKGRKAIASIAHKVSRSKTYLDGVGKELVVELKKKPKLIDAERKRMRETLDGWRDEVRAPLDKWEEDEKKRVADIEARIETLNEYKLLGGGAESSVYEDHLAKVKSFVIDDSLEEFVDLAAKVKDEAVRYLEKYIADQKRYEAEQAELERLQKEKAAQEAKEREEKIRLQAEEKAKREAEEKAKAEREAAEKRETELKLAAEKAEREKLEMERAAKEAEERFKREKAQAAENARLAEERAAREKVEAEQRARRQAEEEARQARQKEADEKAKREADKAHRGSINKEVAQALMAMGFELEEAKKIIVAIVKGEIPNVTINY